MVFAQATRTSHGAQSLAEEGGVQESPVCPFATVACGGSATSGASGHLNACGAQLPSTPREPPALGNGNPYLGFATANAPVHAHTAAHLSLQVPQLRHRDASPKFHSPQAEPQVTHQAVPSMAPSAAPSASAADPYVSQLPMMQQQLQQQRPQLQQHQQPSHQQRSQPGGERHIGNWVGGLEQWGARAGHNAEEHDSLGDLSVLQNMETSFDTPAQLRDSDDWSVHAPPTDDQPPQYVDNGYPNLSCGVTHASSSIEPVVLESRFRQASSQLHSGARSALARCVKPTQPSCRMPEEWVDNGQECFDHSVNLSQIGQIPTPARANRRAAEAPSTDKLSRTKCQDVAIQVNRESMDGHAQRRRQLLEDQSMQSGRADPVRTTGAGLDVSTDSALRGDRSARGGNRNSSMAQLRYPEFTFPDCRVARPDSIQERRIALLQILTQSVSADLKELRHAWGLNTSGQCQNIQQAHYYRQLEKLSRCIEKKCTKELMVLPEQMEQQEAATNEEWQRAIETLEADIAATEKRMAGGSELVQRNSGNEATDCTVEDLVTEIRNAMGQDLAGGLDMLEKLKGCQWVMQLSILDIWFRQLFNHYRDTERGLEEREREASSRAFAHLPGGTAEPRRALLALR